MPNIGLRKRFRSRETNACTTRDRSSGQDAPGCGKKI